MKKLTKKQKKVLNNVGYVIENGKYSVQCLNDEAEYVESELKRAEIEFVKGSFEDKFGEECTEFIIEIEKEN